MDRIEAVIREVIPARDLVGVLDNIGIPSGGIPLTYLDNGVTGTGDADILVSLNRDHRPTDEYVRQLRTRLDRDFAGSTFYFLPADIVNQTINFGLPAPIDIQIMGRDREKSRKIAAKLADFKLKTAIANSARAEVRRLEKIQAFSRVTAPFSGTITVRNIDSGDLIVASGSRELFHLAQTKKLRVLVQVPQEMARSVAIGQSAEMTLPGLPGRKFSAKVLRTSGAIIAESRTLPVEMETDNAKGEILSGSYAKVRFIDVKMKASLTLPANTVLYQPEGLQVGVVDSDGKVSLRSISIGRDFGQTIEIITGVGPQDRVIVNPSDSLVNGMMVAVSESAPAEKKP